MAHWEVNGCGHGHSYSQSRRGIRSIYTSTRPYSKARGKRVRHFIKCSRSAKSEADLRRYAKRMSRWRKSYKGYWDIQERRLSPAMRATLRRLRHCESTGRYHISGHHDGAYQFAVETWNRAQSYVGVPGRYRRARAHWASPDHQDSVTGRFFPYHRSEWACSA